MVFIGWIGGEVGGFIPDSRERERQGGKEGKKNNEEGKKNNEKGKKEEGK